MQWVSKQGRNGHSQINYSILLVVVIVVVLSAIRLFRISNRNATTPDGAPQPSLSRVESLEEGVRDNASAVD